MYNTWELMQKEREAAAALTAAANAYALTLTVNGDRSTDTFAAWNTLQAAHAAYEVAHRDASRAYHMEEAEAGLL